MQVPLLDLTEQYRALESDLQAAVLSVLEGGQFILGPNVKALELELAAYTGVAHAVGVANGSDALVLALQAAGVGAGDEVICPAFTFFATAGSIARVGATPVFAEIEPVTYTLSPADVAARITPRTKAIIPVHLYGHPADLPALQAVAGGLTVIEDTAQAIGATIDGRRVASIGQMGTYSFFPSKNLGAYGDAGMVTTDDADLAERVRLLRAHGSKPKYYHQMLGCNSRLDELQAAILRVKLGHLERWNGARQAAAERYDHLFAEAGLHGQVVTPKVAEGCTHVFHQYTVRAQDRDRLQADLTAGGVGTAVYYPLPLHLQPVFAGLGHSVGHLPVTELACQEALSLPIFPEITPEQQEYVVERVRRFYAAA